MPSPLDGDVDHTIAPRVLPEYTTLVAAEAALWGLAAHVALPVQQMQQLKQALRQLAAIEQTAAAAGTAAGGGGAAAPGAALDKLQRFEAAYACVRAWALVGSRDAVLEEMESMLQHALQ
jgi:predicted MFS family arabinose efflux permease